ncbi:hypothetical protein BJ508DRAFT_363927 [Ascobolus immersus RN42]|uniref:F-box domain-containing protein n=1 Tax=Ascobolus immersus RN42 TaxID=1160509 RepID=A0A3N4HWK3_ASCIM|nr:hypothetical protein BJ508DRAFT_363927 [Ascobolus immersus RN42]
MISSSSQVPSDSPFLTILPPEVRLEIYTHCSTLTLLQLTSTCTSIRTELRSRPTIIKSSYGYRQTYEWVPPPPKDLSHFLSVPRRKGKKRGRPAPKPAAPIAPDALLCINRIERILDAVEGDFFNAKYGFVGTADQFVHYTGGHIYGKVPKGECILCPRCLVIRELEKYENEHVAGNIVFRACSECFGKMTEEEGIVEVRKAGWEWEDDDGTYVYPLDEDGNELPGVGGPARGTAAGGSQRSGSAPVVDGGEIEAPPDDSAIADGNGVGVLGDEAQVAVAPEFV